jgi:hypothetical protein
MDPEFLRFRPSYALIYRMNEYYLGTLGFKRVISGARSISHETKIQDFRIHECGFEKAYTSLNVYYRPPLHLLVNLLYPLRTVLGHANNQLWSILELERCRRACLREAGS